MQSAYYCFQYAVHIAHNIVIPEPENPIIVLAEPLIASGIVRIAGMLTAINLDDQSPFSAYKVNDVATDRLLADELAAIDGARAQPIPKT